MNLELTEQIIKHIYRCLGVKLPGGGNNSYTMMQPEYLLEHKISFDDGQKNNIWGIQLNLDDEAIKVILADCTQDGVPEFALLVAVRDAPSYGAYLCYKEYAEDDSYLPPMIACSVQQGSWAECSIFLQATFLSGMEKLREINTTFKKLEQSEEIYKYLISFINFYQERDNAGQENR